jgi:hypothetical protein
VIADEFRRGRVESDGNGKVRLKQGALAAPILDALGKVEL